MLPVYTQLSDREWERRLRTAEEHLYACNLCPWQCAVNRLNGIKGARCHTGAQAIVSSFSPSYGEEACLTGRAGAGNIFFGMCNLDCVFCHNHAISQHGKGYLVSPDELAEIMLYLQGQGCPNINLVTPTHVIPQILAALRVAVRKGLRVPLVYNTSGFERVEVLQELLDGVIDIYLPDLKFMDPDLASSYMHAPKYVDLGKAAIMEMHRQVGKPVFVDQIMRRGMLIRHVAIPGHQADSYAVFDFVATHISSNAWISILRYRPVPQTQNIPYLNLSLTEEEYRNVLNLAIKRGLRCFDDLSQAPE